MKKFKSFLALALVLIIAFSVVGCSSDEALDTNTTAPSGTAQISRSAEVDISPAYNTEDIVVSENISKAPSLKKAEKSKTIMIYIIGSDLESKQSSASLDILEMIDSGVNTDDVNILIFTGGSKKWGLEGIPADKNCIYKLTDGDFYLEKELKRTNTTDKKTLTEFMKYCIANYKADEYGLILWDHGCGPLYGYGMDEYHENETLSMKEITTALKDAGFNKDKKLEFVGFDACLMGSLETADYLKSYAKYLIASQELEPGQGWDYSFLKKLNEVDGGKNIGKAIVDSYCAYYDALFKKTPSYKSDITLSCLNLSKVSAVEKNLNALFKKVDTKLDSGYFSDAVTHVSKTRVFGAGGESTSVFDLYDLYHLNSKLSKDYEKESKALKKSIDELVVHEGGNVKNANGVSIYHPFCLTEYTDKWLKTYKESEFATDYYKYMSEIINTAEAATSSSYDDFSSTSKASVAVKGGKKELSVKLTDEQVDNYLNSTYYVLKKMNDNEYKFIFAGFDADLSGNTLTASYNDKAIYAKNSKTGEYSEDPVTMIQLRDDSDFTRYCVSTMFWYSPVDGDIEDFKVDVVDWIVELNDNKINKLGAYLVPDTESSSLTSKTVLNYKNYTEVEFSFSTRTPKKDKNGNLLPYFEWDSTGNFYGNQYSVADDFTFEQKAVDDGEYYFMFTVKDIYNNEYTSSLQKLN